MAMFVSIPLEQGGVFRHDTSSTVKDIPLFQSLWNKAVSFDCGGGLVP